MANHNLTAWQQAQEAAMSAVWLSNVTVCCLVAGAEANAHQQHYYCMNYALKWEQQLTEPF